MKEAAYTDLICKGFCSFYREGKEEFTCGAYEFLVKNLTERELRNLTISTVWSHDLSSDDYIERIICRRCDFYKEDCDFRAGKKSPPCGGYVIIESLRRWLVG